MLCIIYIIICLFLKTPAYLSLFSSICFVFRAVGLEVILSPGGQEVLIDGPGHENHILQDTSNGPYRLSIERRPTLLRHSELSEQLNKKPRGDLSSDGKLLLHKYYQAVGSLVSDKRKKEIKI